MRSSGSIERLTFGVWRLALAMWRFEARSAEENLVRRLPDESASPRYGVKKGLALKARKKGGRG
jgi:hypothetical protein